MFQPSDAMPVITELPSILATSAISVATIQALKKSNLPFLKFINQHSDRVNIVANVIAAFLSGIGMHYTYDAQVGTLLLTGLTGPAIRHSIFETGRSYAFNWLIYEGVVKKRAADVAALQEAKGLPGTPKVLAVSPGDAASAAEAGTAKAEVRQKRKFKKKRGQRR